MFGTLRYALAEVVLVNHFTAASLIGKYAVYVFFMLSGYLMTHILNRVYRENIQGYLVNRLLRIYPTYLAVLFLTIAACAFIPGFELYRHAGEDMVPATAWAWVSAILMLNVDLVGPAWTLKIELVYYVLMIFLSLSPTRVRIWFGVSLVIAVLIGIGAATGLLVRPSFSNVIAASVPFSFGAWLWYRRQVRPASFKRIAAFGALLAASMVVPVLIDLRQYKVFEWLGLLSTTALGGLLVLDLSYIRASGLVKRVDDFLGDLSYPVYLAHILVGSLVMLASPAALALGLTAITVVMTHLVSLAIRAHVEEPLALLRSKIRDNRATDMRPQQVRA